MSKSYIINFFESIARILLIGCSRITIGFDRLPQANMLGKHSTKNLADLIQHTGQWHIDWPMTYILIHDSNGIHTNRELECHVKNISNSRMAYKQLNYYFTNRAFAVQLFWRKHHLNSVGLIIKGSKKINKPQKRQKYYYKYLPIKTVLSSLILQMLSDHKR
jgi:hypothetical protein